MNSRQPQTSDNSAKIFINTTLLYTSHMSNWAIYFDPSQPGHCQYCAQQFEGRGGGKTQGTALYEINSLGQDKWQIAIRGADPDNINALNFTIIFWIDSFDSQSLDHQTAIAATGNVYDDHETPMWPGGEKAMDFVFQRGKSLQGDR